MKFFNENRTCEVQKNETKNGVSWEVATYPTNCPREKRIFKTQFHVFEEATDLIEFIAFHEFKAK